MRFRPFVWVAIALVIVPGGYADTVVDVSKEWKEHASTSGVRGIPGGTASSPTPKAGAHPAPSPDSEDSACECDPLTPKERLDQSTLAFTGRVLETHLPKKGRQTVIFDVDEIFKGSPSPETTVIVEVSGDGCDLPFEEGQPYLVFANWEWGMMVTSRCRGTKYLDKARVSALGPDQELKEKIYIRLRNLCMGRRDTSCCLASLKALHAGYYLPEPDEGCPAGSIPDRLHCGGSYTWCVPLLEKTHSQP